MMAMMESIDPRTGFLAVALTLQFIACVQQLVRPPVVMADYAPSFNPNEGSGG